MIKIDPAKSGVSSTKQILKIEERLFVLAADKPPEKLVLWWIEAKNKILNRKGLPWTNRLSVLSHIITDKMRTIVMDIIIQTGTDVDNHKWKKKLTKERIRQLWES